jgi:hypothetical protein
MRGISWVAENLLVSQKGLYLKESITGNLGQPHQWRARATFWTPMSYAQGYSQQPMTYDGCQVREIAVKSKLMFLTSKMIETKQTFLHLHLYIFQHCPQPAVCCSDLLSVKVQSWTWNTFLPITWRVDVETCTFGAQPSKCCREHLSLCKG